MAERWGSLAAGRLEHIFLGRRPAVTGRPLERMHFVWQFRFRVPGKNFVVVSDHNLIPAILGRPGLPKTSLYLWTRTVRTTHEWICGSCIVDLRCEDDHACLPCAQLFNPYGHDNLFTYIQHNDQEWKVVRKAFAKSMSAERIR